MSQTVGEAKEKTAASALSSGLRLVTWIDALVGPDARTLQLDRDPAAFDWTVVAGVMVTLSIGLIFVAIGQGAGRRDDADMIWLYWLGLIIITGPASVRLAMSNVGRNERLIVLIAVALSFFIVKMIFSPSSFAHFDEFLHWSAAIDMMDSGRLFTPNPLLPVGPFYPALEIVTTCIANMTGLSLFASATIILAVARCLSILALFLYFERCAGSSRIAGLACLAFMSNPNFVFFHSQFAYESLAFPFFVTIIFVESGRLTSEAPSRGSLLLSLSLVLSLTFIHHMTSYITAGLLAALFVLDYIKRDRTNILRTRALIAAVALAVPIIWSWRAGAASHSGSLLHYLGPVFQSGVNELLSFLRGIGGRRLFVSADGSMMPLWMRLLSMASVLLSALGIACGFFTAVALSAPNLNWRGVVDVLRRKWVKTDLLLLALMGACFPLTILLRFTSAGWEIGFRMTPFAYVGVAALGAFALIRLLKRVGRLSGGAVVAAIMSVCVLGGLIAGWGVPCVRQGYAVSADALSVEPMGIAAAEWMRAELGPGNKVAADRINSILLATYGRQSPVLGVDIAHVFTSTKYAAEQADSLKRNRIEYLVVDLRLTSGLPQVGVYFDKGEYRGPQVGPPLSSSFLKFNAIPQASRVFDNGSIVIFDVRRLYAST